MGLGDGTWQGGGLGQVPVTALVAYILCAQQFGDELERFLEHGAILRQIHPKTLELVLLIAGAKTHLHTPPGDDIEHGDFFGELNGIAQRQHHHGGAEADLFGALGQDGDQQQGIG